MAEASAKAVKALPGRLTLDSGHTTELAVACGGELARSHN
jgi:hypothetical protein